MILTPFKCHFTFLAVWSLQPMWHLWLCVVCREFCAYYSC